jgi:hypothetical protein
MDLLVQPRGETTLGHALRRALMGELGEYRSLTAAVAFVRRSGVQCIESELRTFVGQGGRVLMVVGLDHHGTSVEGLSDLLFAVGDTGQIWVNHDEDPYVTFHPKVYLFESESSSLLIVGSGNLTLGGLYRNDEVSACCALDPTDEDDAHAIIQIKAAVSAWCNEELGTALRLDESLLETLQDVGYVAPEAASRGEGRAEAEAAGDATPTVSEARSAVATPLFVRGEGRPMPARGIPSQVAATPEMEAEVTMAEPRGFVMTLMRTDVGVGQVTPGASRRSPEVFVPLVARDKHGTFWGWRQEFSEDPSKPGKFDRRGVPMRLGGEVITVNMMTWPDKHDFRLRSEALRSAGAEGDILRIEKAVGGLDFAYYVEIIPPGTTGYEYYSSLCTEPTPNSDRMWGYYDG